MKNSFKKEIEKLIFCEKEVLAFSVKVSYNSGAVAEFSALAGIPIYYIYYCIWKTHGIEDAKDNMNRLLEYYNFEYDLED